ncbi:MAG: hypothetical protein K5707_04940, partial [Clostridia bacterium]|nr:hypothetical protein [Clostridia bacterium]
MVPVDAETLDLLMRITGTTNAALGRALSFDASYISRIRHGKRRFPQEEAVLAKMAHYFQQADPGTLVAAPAAGAESIESEGPALLRTPIGRDSAAAPTSFYYGNPGKRDAVRRLLKDLDQRRPAGELLLYSDEDMSWLFEDASFISEWQELLTGLLLSGWRITIIHTVSRAANDMYEAIREWLPLYLSGRVTPYYYPLLRDDVFHHTLFIARGFSALIGSSVSGQSGMPLNLYIKDTAASEVLAQEFAAYLAVCRPLLQTVSRQDPAGFRQALAVLSASSGPLRFTQNELALLFVKDEAAFIISKDENGAGFLIREPRL